MTNTLTAISPRFLCPAHFSLPHRMETEATAVTNTTCFALVLFEVLLLLSFFSFPVHLCTQCASTLGSERGENGSAASRSAQRRANGVGVRRRGGRLSLQLRKRSCSLVLSARKRSGGKRNTKQTKRKRRRRRSGLEAKGENGLRRHGRRSGRNGGK